MSPDFLPPARCDFPTQERGNDLCRGFFIEEAVFPFSRGKDRFSQGVENRGSLISVPLALRVALLGLLLRLPMIHLDLVLHPEELLLLLLLLRRKLPRALGRF